MRHPFGARRLPQHPSVRTRRSTASLQAARRPQTGCCCDRRTVYIHHARTMMRALLLKLLLLNDLSCLFALSTASTAPSIGGCGRSGQLVALASISPRPDTARLYTTMDKLLRAAERSSPSVRALNRCWLTLPPSELVENALVIGATLVGSFRQGCELVAQAEEHAGLMLSPRSYAALMQLGLAEQRWLEVLGLLGRVRSRGMTPSAGMLRASMRAAANIGDWGAVCRLFNELAGAEKSSEALELIGSPKVLAELRAELGGAEEDAKRLVSLTPADADAIRLAMRAHCARGDTALVTAALLRMRELGCGLGVANYVDIFELAVKKRALSALQAITPQDVAFSVGSALEPKIFALRNTAANMPRADKELLVLVAGAALAAGAIAAASHVNSAPDIDHLSF